MSVWVGIIVHGYNRTPMPNYIWAQYRQLNSIHRHMSSTGLWELRTTCEWSETLFSSPELVVLILLIHLGCSVFLTWDFKKTPISFSSHLFWANVCPASGWIWLFLACITPLVAEQKIWHHQKDREWHAVQSICQMFSCWLPSYSETKYKAHTTQWYNVVLMLHQCRRHRTKIRSTFGQRFELFSCGVYCSRGSFIKEWNNRCESGTHNE